jgi:hypothetical protein
MMVPNERRNLRQRGVLGDHVSADVRVTPHYFPFLFAQRSRLVENVVSNPDLAQIVK